MAAQRNEFQITLSVNVNPVQFINSAREHSNSAIAATQEAALPGTWRLRIVGQSGDHPGWNPSVFYVRNRTDLTVKAYLSLDQTRGQTWISRNASLYIIEQGSATGASPVSTNTTGRSRNEQAHSHPGSGSPRPREIFGDLLTPLLSMQSRNRSCIVRCTVTIRPLEVTPHGYVSYARVLPADYLNGDRANPALEQADADGTNAERVNRNFLSLFEGDPFNKDDFTNCRVVFGDKTYHCHQSVLASSGRVFKAQLTAPLEGGEPGVFHIDLPSVTLEEDGVDAFMMALYRPESLQQVESPTALVQIYHLLDYYGVEAISNICTVRLGGMVNNDTATDLAIFASNFNLEVLLERCIDHCASLPQGTFTADRWVSFCREHPALMGRITDRMARNRDRDIRQLQSLQRSADAQVAAPPLYGGPVPGPSWRAPPIREDAADPPGRADPAADVRDIFGVLGALGQRERLDAPVHPPRRRRPHSPAVPRCARLHRLARAVERVDQPGQGERGQNRDAAQPRPAPAAPEQPVAQPGPAARDRAAPEAANANANNDDAGVFILDFNFDANPERRDAA